MTRFSVGLRRALVVAAPLAFVACADEGPTDPDPTPPGVAEIRFEVDDSLGFYAGESIQLGAAAYDSTGTVIPDRPITWTISDPHVVSVDSLGVLSALAQGTTTVTATANDVSATLTIRITEFVEIALHTDPLCARDVEGAVWCIGTEWHGREAWPHPLYEQWQQVSGDLVFSSLASGWQHTCGIADAAYCWGSNEKGMLGAGPVSPMYSVAPLAVTGGHDFAALDGGWEHTCGIDADGDAYCWGRGLELQLGNGVATVSNEPVLVAGGHDWLTLEAAQRSTCGVDAEGVTYCWGELMHADSTALLPTAVPDAPFNVDRLSGQWDGACASADVLVDCWGDFIPDPAQMTFAQPVLEIVLAEDAACALLADGDVQCWGSNEDLQLGNASITSTTTPLSVAGGRSYVGLVGGGHMLCAQSTDGGIYCWGEPYHTDRPLPASAEPARVPAPMP